MPQNEPGYEKSGRTICRLLRALQCFSFRDGDERKNLMYRDSRAMMPRQTPEKSKVLCGLLYIFLGYLGATIASFYLEQQMRYLALPVCIVSIVVFPIFFFLWIVCAIVGLVILVMSDERFEEHLHFTRDHNFWGDRNIKHCRTGECVRKGQGLHQGNARQAAGGMKNCPHCGVFIPRTAAICRNCGSDIPTLQPAAGAGSSRRTRDCPYCAESIMYEALKCRYCGSDLPAPQEVSPRATIRRTKTCPYCAEEIAREELKCRYCGSEVRNEAPGVTDSQ